MPEIGTVWRRWVVGDGFVVEYVIVPEYPTIAKTIIVAFEGSLARNPNVQQLLGAECDYTIESFRQHMKPYTGLPTTYEEFSSS